ncbi:hypothetical protein B0T10DRAFT_502438 [Thelonectria olida]|uniref:HNH nuclease domain-containing protein n=1 Tax=Thelonectria olida TaxID=1576542 RepID=A0A9P9ADT8_9HYPO|nr:hypothetical protein B0T10DRAFT_502438 [Thelonectria olida]
MAQFLQPFTPPSTSLGSPSTDIRCISFRHPAYPEYAPELLHLTAVDGENRDGIDYLTALVACCIVTGNMWHTGWLATKDTAGAFARVDRPEDGILRGDTYYFRLGEHDTAFKYPVLPSFDHWRFPHGDVPTPWSDLAIPPSSLSSIVKQRNAAISRDGTCRISGYFYATEVAHIVPRSAGSWFDSNNMKRYCRVTWDPQPIDDERNLLLLRKDLHHLFDQRRLTFVAKQVDDAGPPNLATHVLLTQGSTELVNLYQNRLPQPLVGISAELMFARFAWALFTDEIFPFFGGMHEYEVLLFDPETGQHSTKRLRAPEIRGQLFLFNKYSRSRSTSPHKRTDDQVSQGDASDEVDCLEERTWRSDVDGPSDNDSEPRGRRRKRTYYRHESPGFLGSASSASRSASHNLPDTSTQGSTATDPGSDGVEYDDEDTGRPRKRRHVEVATGIALES